MRIDPRATSVPGRRRVQFHCKKRRTLDNAQGRIGMVISITECELIGSRAAPEPVITSLRCDLVKSRNLLMQDGGVDAMVQCERRQRRMFPDRHARLQTWHLFNLKRAGRDKGVANPCSYIAARHFA